MFEGIRPRHCRQYHRPTAGQLSQSVKIAVINLTESFSRAIGLPRTPNSPSSSPRPWRSAVLAGSAAASDDLGRRPNIFAGLSTVARFDRPMPRVLSE
jgi:hypothetical protein